MYRSNRSVIFWVTILLLFNVKIYAQEKLSLTIEQAIEIGLQNSKLLHSSLMKVKGAEAKVREVNAMRLPSLKLSSGYRRLSPIDPFSVTIPGMGTFNISSVILDNYSAQLTLFQPIFTGFRLLGNSDMNEQLSNAVNEDYNKDKSELIFNIKNAYWGLFKATQFQKVMDETVDQIKAHVADAKNLEKVGMMTTNDILKIEVQLSNTLYQQVDAENSVKLAAVALCNTLGISLETRIEILSSANMSSAQFDELNKLVGDAITKRSEIKAADSRVKASEAGVTLAKSSWYPQVSVVGNYYYSRPNQRIQPSKDQFDATWDVGVNLSLNVWDWLTTKHQTDQAETQLSQAVDAMGMIKDGITLEVTQNYLSFSQAKRKIEIAELSVKQATENLKVTNDKFKNGLATTTELVDAETALIGSKTNNTTAVVDYELSKAKLEKSIGK
ncbi:MAG: TolC family protein [Ignavibacteriales bacterium]|nr:TolC family protein [Ignavibacteriales bacterium]